MNEKFMKEAIKLAEENASSSFIEGGPFGAVVVKDGKIIGRGKNRVLIDNDPTAHAEIVAIRDACKNLKTYNLKDCKLYTNCFPCSMCLSSIIWANIKTVYYGNKIEDIVKLKFRDGEVYDVINDIYLEKNSQMVKLVPLMREEATKTLEKFEKYSKKELY